MYVFLHVAFSNAVYYFLALQQQACVKAASSYKASSELRLDQAQKLHAVLQRCASLC